MSFITTYVPDVPGNNTQKENTDTAKSLDRYLCYRLEMTKFKSVQPAILLVELNYRWKTDQFIQWLKTKRNGDVNGILFYTHEELCRGDAPNSPFNKSRMVREFFENSFIAVTANDGDLFCKFSILIQKIFKNEEQEKPIRLSVVNTNLAGLQTVLGEKNINNLANGYFYGGIHTSDGHKVFRKVIDEVRKSEPDQNPGTLAVHHREIIERGDTFDKASIFAHNPFQFGPFEILLIDDNPETVADDLKKLKKYFPDKTKFYITGSAEWVKIASDQKHNFWRTMYNKDAQLSLKDIFQENESDFSLTHLFNDKKIFRFNFVIVDLLLGEYNEGNKVINNLEWFRLSFNRLNPGTRTYFDLLALSLSEEAPDIHRALNEGGLVFIPKKRIYMLPAVIAELEKSRLVLSKRADAMKALLKPRNFSKLENLPEMIKRKLKNDPFLDRLDSTRFLEKIPQNESGTGGKEKEEREEKVIQFRLNRLNKFIEISAHQWIKNMPKADLHCHLGGSMRGETAFFLSLNMLVTPSSSGEPSKDDDRDYIEELAGKTIELMWGILFGDFSKIKYLFMRFRVILNAVIELDLDHRILSEEEHQKVLGNFLEKLAKISEKKADNEAYISVVKVLNEELKTIANIGHIKSIIKFLTDSHLNSFIRAVPFEKIKAEEVFFKTIENYVKVNALQFPSFQAVNIFNVLIGIIERKTGKDINAFWDKLKPLTKLDSKIENWRKHQPFLTNGIKNNFGKIKKDCKALYKKIKKYELITATIKDLHEPNLLTHYISAKKRGSKSLASYLGGCEFTGAEQLRKKENIIAALYDVIERNKNDNVRLLELKLSPDGYVGDGMTLQEAIQTTLTATDLITLHFYHAGDFIRVNYIFTVKRHKQPEEAALEISAAIVNRERESLYNDIKPVPNEKNVETLRYHWQPSKVVGVDLAGLEKGNPARNFISDFYPLFKTSSFLTIHAGEEDTSRSIWEAVYLLHANRIGHGLTLNDNLQLKELFKNFQICIELNPISNTLTNPDINNRYPFYDFMKEGQKVTINTDNPAVSDSTLSEEFVKAAELFQTHRNNNKGKVWLSKWGILRIIKNAFSSAFMEREEKRMLMRAVEEEIYQKLIEEYGVT